MRKLKNLNEDVIEAIIVVTIFIYIAATFVARFTNETLFMILMAPIVIILAFLFIGGLFFSDWSDH